MTSQFASIGRGRFVMGVLLALGAWQLGCEDVGKKSAAAARDNVTFIAAAAKQDVTEVRSGLPQGAGSITKLFSDAAPEVPGAEDARSALERARETVQDLRVAKSTFFAVVHADGRVIRNDREQDLMAGKNLFQFFPGLQAASEYFEGRGSMPEAAGVRGREDGQWLAAVPVRLDGSVRGYYVTGWSWSAYAYRLETGLRSHILTGAKSGEKIPLLYVFVVVDKNVHGAPVSPKVNAEAIAKAGPLAKASAGAPWTTVLTIDGREFGLAVQLVPELGDKVALAVLRSET